MPLLSDVVSGAQGGPASPTSFLQDLIRQININSGQQDSLVGQNIPPPSQEAPGSGLNILGRALAGTAGDVPGVLGAMNPFSGVGQGLTAGANAALGNQGVQNLLGGLTGQEPSTFTPRDLTAQAAPTSNGELGLQEPTVSLSGGEVTGESIQESEDATPEARDTEAENRKRNNLFSLLIPAVVAGIGMGVPGALAGAAGFNQGFAKALQDSQLSEKDKLEALAAGIEVTDALELQDLRKQEEGDPSSLTPGQKARLNIKTHASKNPQLTASLLKALDEPKGGFLNSPLGAKPDPVNQAIKRNMLLGLGRPEHIPPEDWAQATPEERADFLLKQHKAQ